MTRIQGCAAFPETPLARSTRLRVFSLPEHVRHLLYRGVHFRRGLLRGLTPPRGYRSSGLGRRRHTLRHGSHGTRSLFPVVDDLVAAQLPDQRLRAGALDFKGVMSPGPEEFHGAMKWKWTVSPSSGRWPHRLVSPPPGASDCCQPRIPPDPPVAGAGCRH